MGDSDVLDTSDQVTVSRAMTIDFVARLPIAHDLDIPEVMSTLTGRLLKARKLMSRWSYETGLKARFKALEGAKTGKPRYLCARCLKAVKLAGHAIPDQNRKVFYFKHAEGDQGCDWRTDGLSESIIKARQYQGQREGEAHKRIKALIAASLDADPDMEAVLVEKVWKPVDGDRQWRKPDVSARFARKGERGEVSSIRFSFEAQLSTTFISVVIDRKIFYQAEGALLVWIMPSFIPDDRLLMHDDIFIANNSNMLVVDRDTAARSVSEGRFFIRVHWREPRRANEEIIWDWSQRIAAFDELTLDLEKQRAFLFDADQAKRKLIEAFAEEQRAKRAEQERLATETEAERRRQRVAVEEARDEALRVEFMDLLRSKAKAPIDEKPWEELREKFMSRGIPLPAWAADRGFTPLVQAIASAKEGTPVGYRVGTLLRVGNAVFDHHKHHLRYFARALINYRTLDVLRSQDTTGKWARREKEMHDGWARGDPAYQSDKTWITAIRFLFPGALDKAAPLGAAQNATNDQNRRAGDADD